MEREEEGKKAAQKKNEQGSRTVPSEERKSEWANGRKWKTQDFPINDNQRTINWNQTDYENNIYVQLFCYTE